MAVVGATLIRRSTVISAGAASVSGWRVSSPGAPSFSGSCLLSATALRRASRPSISSLVRRMRLARVCSLTVARHRPRRERLVLGFGAAADFGAGELEVPVIAPE